MSTIERRTITSELRASQGDEPSIMGYAASFNVLSQDLGGFKEIIAPGAFDKSLAGGDDCRCLFNHDPSQVLGRRSAGTLKLSKDAKGLKFVCALDPDNSDHMNLRSSILRGDIKECSFSFTVPDGGDSFDEATDETGVRFVRRTLRNVNLMDVSAVTYPAYSAPGATEVQARARQACPACQSGDCLTHSTTERLAQVLAMKSDWERQERAHQNSLRLAADNRPKEKRGNQDFMADRCSDAMRGLNPPLSYCCHSEDHAFGADPDDDDENRCYRFAYELDGDGNLTLDEDSRTACSHAVSHSVRSLKRERKELRLRMEAASGIVSR